MSDPRDRWLVAVLRCGWLVPIGYFAAQVLAAPFYPDYSVVRQAASDLGSDASRFPQLFNVGAILTGVAALTTAVSMVSAGLRWRLLWWSLPVAVAVVMVGLGNIWAGLYPLPDARHGNNPFNAGFFLMPLMALVLAWRLPDATGLRWSMGLNLLVLLGLVAARASNADVGSIEGAFQRVLAAVVFVPIGVSAEALARHGLARGSGIG